jgi:hypothetical protein
MSVERGALIRGVAREVSARPSGAGARVGDALERARRPSAPRTARQSDSSAANVVRRGHPDGLERSEDASRQLRRAAAIDELEQVVQIEVAVARESACEGFSEARVLEHLAPPVPDVGSDSAPRRAVQVRFHDWLAPRRGVVLRR